MMPTGSIVSAAALRDLLESSDDLVLLDAGRDRTAFDAGHLAGARYAGLNEHLSGVTGQATDAARGGRHPLPGIEPWCRTLGDWGIAPSTNVIVYDDQAGAIAAARAWWMLRGIGHERVAVLDGGLVAALAAGLPLSAASAVVSPRPPYPGDRWLRPTVDIDKVDELRRDPEWMVLDVRSAERYAGREETLDPVAGHIPGAVNLPFAGNLSGGCFKAPEELFRLYEEWLNGVPADHLIVHCGSGVTACHTLLALEIAGIHGAALYVGSWSEWCRNPRPRATAAND